ncbi:hypothetical protein [Marinobacter mangrovi]|uniref:hypothetical protein n=1 Tax=Marinobacter mangrovi TaxID=2803918 RepID=UPI0019336004|nr:hypothetical protein [Marinobacter mangrovi]
MTPNIEFLIKIASTVFSTKAVIGLLSLATGVFLSWTEIYPFLKDSIPKNVSEFITTTLGLAIGITLSLLINFIIEKGEKKFGEIKKEKEAKEEKIKNERKLKNERLKTKERFESVFAHLRLEQKDILRHLSVEHQVLDSGNAAVHALEKNKYIIKSELIKSTYYVYKINSVISHLVEQNWDKERQEELKNFRIKYGTDADYLLMLFSIENDFDEPKTIARELLERIPECRYSFGSQICRTSLEEDPVKIIINDKLYDSISHFKGDNYINAIEISKEGIIQ